MTQPPKPPDTVTHNGGRRQSAFLKLVKGSSKTTHRVIDSLLYPAFLGNMSYVALEKLFNNPDSYTRASALLAAALLLHYVMDWAYTINNASGEPYYHLKFVADLVIVLCLYVAVRLSLEDQVKLFSNAPEILKQPVFWLVVTKVCSVFWELVEVLFTTAFRWTKTKRLALFVDGAALVVYLVFLFAAEPSQHWIVLAVVVVIDSVLYPIHDYARRKWKNQ